VPTLIHQDHAIIKSPSRGGSGGLRPKIQAGVSNLFNERGLYAKNKTPQRPVAMLAVDDFRCSYYHFCSADP
jgi:hypothetical protein